LLKKQEEAKTRILSFDSTKQQIEKEMEELDGAELELLRQQNIYDGELEDIQAQDMPFNQQHLALKNRLESLNEELEALRTESVRLQTLLTSSAQEIQMQETLLKDMEREEAMLGDRESKLRSTLAIAVTKEQSARAVFQKRREEADVMSLHEAELRRLQVRLMGLINGRIRN